MVNSDGANSKRKRQRQTTSSLAGRQLLPVIVEIPAGSILFFSALMHAGYGIWSLDEMLIRPAPSMDDMMRTSISDLLIRYQAHVARPKQQNSFKSIDLRRQSEVTTYRAKHLTSISTIACHSHFYSHPSSLLTEWLGEELVYDRSRFLGKTRSAINDSRGRRPAERGGCHSRDA